MPYVEGQASGNSALTLCSVAECQGCEHQNFTLLKHRIHTTAVVILAQLGAVSLPKGPRDCVFTLVDMKEGKLEGLRR